jgi:hypothetical protein
MGMSFGALCAFANWTTRVEKQQRHIAIAKAFFKIREIRMAHSSQRFMNHLVCAGYASAGLSTTHFVSGELGDLRG